MTTNSAELKPLPCPFCGYFSRVQSRNAKSAASGKHFFVRCPSCHTEGPRSTLSEAEAIERWNERQAGRTAAQGDQSNYAELESEHLGDLDKRTGIYHQDVIADSQAGSAEQVSEREAFEKHFGPKDGFSWRDEDGCYKVVALQTAWKVWQAACSWQRAALSAPERKVPQFIVRAAERAIHDATHPTGMHTNGPAMARIEASKLNALLRYAALNQQGEQTAPEATPIGSKATEYLQTKLDMLQRYSVTINLCSEVKMGCNKKGAYVKFVDVRNMLAATPSEG